MMIYPKNARTEKQYDIITFAIRPSDAVLLVVYQRRRLFGRKRTSGILNFRFHDLRHTFASHFVMQGGDLLTLKEILGHSSMEMVQRYSHLAQSHKLKQVNNLSGLFSQRHL